ncbi:MAG: hypothetical protein AUH81_20355 [Candidatus Rokubacteria bacterium 13_1_40CM_4_69_5]|nr:MAG: hypothetical protein AUH81_20355 [Candidatus Rokubacteria bacterium 13_1_40CM_4_69_5]
MHLDAEPRVRLLEAGGHALGGVERQCRVPDHPALALRLREPSVLGRGGAGGQDHGEEDQRGGDLEHR